MNRKKQNKTKKQPNEQKQEREKQSNKSLCAVHLDPPNCVFV